MAKSKTSKHKLPPWKFSLTPELKIASAFRARCRFKALVRFVIENLYWLADFEEEEEKLGDDIQKNILLVMRKKGVQPLKLKEKLMLSKPLHQRTEEEKAYLFRVIGTLSCFRSYPGHVKRQLSGATTFIYFGPGRTMIRQGHEADALYILLTGEVTILQETFDPVLNKNVTLNLGTMGPGSRIGEVSLLHNIKRTATVITNTHCEFLSLKKVDFNAVLRETVQQHWDDTKDAMKMFTYFESWDETAIRECCVLSKLKTYDTDEIVLGDGFGFPHYVYFILQGRLQIIEHLLVTSCNKNGNKIYKLYEPLPADTASQNISTANASQQTSKLSQKKSVFSHTYSRSTYSTVDQIGSTISKYTTDKTSNSSVFIRSTSDETSVTWSLGSALKHDRTVDLDSVTVQSKRETVASSVGRNSSAIGLPSNVETHFMQVCLLNPRACFGIGENLNHRRIIAVTHTKCLLIPRSWLMQKNVGNVWHRIQSYLNTHIPSTKDVFREFTKQQKWLRYRKQLFNDMFKRKLPNLNSVLNIPHFIRLHPDKFE